MLVENLPQKTFLKDCRSVYVYCNNSYASDLGLTPERIVGKTDRDLYPPSSAEKHIAEDRAIIASGKPVEVVERYWKDSKEMIIRVFKTPIRDEAGTIRGLLGMIWDVTERMRLESIAEAVNTMDNIGYVFSGIRHEIGNPVNSLKITLGVLRNRIDSFTKEDITEYINRCMSEISRVEYLLKALRNFNMYEVPERREIGMNAFMERFIALVSDDCGSRGIGVKSSVAPDAPRAYADPRALQQVLLNIVSNAMDAVDGRDDPVIEFAVTKMEDMIKIRVVDNGRGMSEQQQRDLFKPFRTTKERGTGLGLVIARKMTAKMNGAINVVSHYGEGTIVDILIPENKE
jgi:PAS domain S-box-containing protein